MIVDQGLAMGTLRLNGAGRRKFFSVKVADAFTRFNDRCDLCEARVRFGDCE